MLGLLCKCGGLVLCESGLTAIQVFVLGHVGSVQQTSEILLRTLLSKLEARAKLALHCVPACML